MSLLKMDDHESVWSIKTEPEIITWCAHLKNSHYLHTKGNLVHNIHGEVLSDCLVDFGDNIKQKRLKFFEMAKTTLLQNIKYENLNILPGHVMEEILPIIFGNGEEEN